MDRCRKLVVAFAALVALVVAPGVALGSTCTQYRAGFNGNNPNGAWFGTQASACTSAPPSRTSCTMTWVGASSACNCVYSGGYDSYAMVSRTGDYCGVNCVQGTAPVTKNATVGWARKSSQDTPDTYSAYQAGIVGGAGGLSGLVVGQTVCDGQCYYAVVGPTSGGWHARSPSPNGLYRISADYPLLQSPSECSARTDSLNPAAPPKACDGYVGTVNGVPTCVAPSGQAAETAVTVATSAPLNQGNPQAFTRGDGQIKDREPVDGTGTAYGGPQGTGDGGLRGSGSAVNGVPGSSASSPVYTQPAGGSSEPTDVCAEHPDAAGCRPFGAAPDSPEVGASGVTLGIGEGYTFGAEDAACPSPREVSIHGLTISMPFDLLCQFADGIRPVIIGMAWLGAVLAFLGLSRKAE